MLTSVPSETRPSTGGLVWTTTTSGLPAHALLVHVVVVLVPVAAAMVVCSAVWPAARRRLGVATPVVAFVALVSVPLATHAGEWLEARVPSTPLFAGTPNSATRCCPGWWGCSCWRQGSGCCTAVPFRPPAVQAATPAR